MIITYDQAKNLRNIEQRGIPFDLAAHFDFETAIFELDRRRDYQEQRVRALGRIGARIHVLVFVRVAGGIRVISLRKAHSREVRHYESETQP